MQGLGRVFGYVLAVLLRAFSIHAMAEAQLAGRDFNHDATGFPLTGVHKLSACETCHVGGVFKGTPRSCDSCHALGKRVVAMPKSTNHIVTDAPCDSCHFNASTFLGARFNHGTAVPGQCRTCHNGSQSIGKPANHSSGNMALDSCDQCHRSYTWFSASWNHVGVTPHSCDKAGCHVSGANPYFRSTTTHTLTYMRTGYCDDCHGYTNPSWPATHMPPTKQCSGCHNNIDAKGTNAFPGHMAIPAGVDCQGCHASTTTASTSWVGGVYNHAAAGVVLGAGTCSTGSGCHGTGSGNRFTAASHVYSPHTYTLMMTTPGCDSCHLSFSNWTATHIAPSGTCSSCHDDVKAKGPASFAGHTAISVGQDCQTCHTATTPTQTSSWAGGAGMPALHLKFNAAAPCSICHVGASGYTTPVNTNTLHANVGSYSCADCHITPNAAAPKGSGSPNTQRTKSSHSGSSGSNCTGCHTHSSAGSFNSWGG